MWQSYEIFGLRGFKAGDLEYTNSVSGYLGLESEGGAEHAVLV